MAQLVGRKRPITVHTITPQSENHFRVSAEPVDHHDNAALFVTTYPNTQKRVIDESGAPGTTFVGAAFPGTATGDANWQIQRITVAGATTTIEWATISPGGSVPDRAATFEHIFDDRAILTYT